VLGMGLATLIGFAMAKASQFPLAVDWHVWLFGTFAIVFLAIAVGLLPGLRARRLKIVDALAGR
jgi:putative ABC transport system permease protein